MRSASSFANGVAGILIVAMAMVADADTLYVNGSCGNDAWTGTSSACSAPNGPKLTIQAGIDASVNGDTVLVADGTYTGVGNKNLSFHRKAISVRSEGGPTACVIDCENAGRGFFFNGESEQSILEGFSIRNGAVSRDGGGVWCLRGSPTLIDCTFSENQADRSGGGMYNEEGSSPTLIDCTFSENQAGRHGGGMLNGSSSPTLIGCTFIGNTAALDGGGMFNSSSSPTLNGCQFIDNRAEDEGGGMFNRGDDGTSAPILTNCTFRGNTAELNGGAMANLGGTSGGLSNPTLTNCTVRGNTAGDSGGGLYNRGGTSGGSCTPTLINCAIFGNTAGDDGGGLLNRGGTSGGSCTPTLINCAVFGNTAGDSGGGLYNISGTSGGTVDSTLTNCTISGNNGGIWVRARGVGTAELTVKNCIVWGNGSGQINGSAANITVTFSNVQGGFSGIGNLSADPLFTNPARGIYCISAGSPAIDAGDNSAVPPEITMDLAGNPRFVDDPSTPDCRQAPGQCGDPPVVDMGAFEFPGGFCDACDMNCDGDINEFDIEPFVNLLFDPSAQPCDPCTGDTNGDRRIDAGDIEGFINCLFP